MAKGQPRESVTLKGRDGRRLTNLARKLGYQIVGGRGSHLVVSRGKRRITLWPPYGRHSYESQAKRLERDDD